jgi:hypothetical protein
LELDNLGAGLPSVPIDVGAVDAVVVSDLRLGGGGGGAGDQSVVVENLVVSSPYDPLTPVLRFERVGLVFSWEGLQRQEIRSLVVRNPTVYVGPDLFYFADQVQAARSSVVGRSVSVPWVLEYFRLTGGRLVVYSFGKPGFALPMNFSAESEHMVLDDFASLPFNRLGFDIPPTDLAYAQAGLSVRQLSGALFVGLPLSDPRAQSLTPSLQIEEVDWKGVRVTDVKTFVTFSRDGIITKLWAKTKGGLSAEDYDLSAGVYVNLNDFSWAGWGDASEVVLGRLTRMLSPENFIMDGEATGHFIVRGKLSEVTGLGATLSLGRSGRIQIVSVDEMLKKLPGDWWRPKRDAVKLLLEAFRDYDYASGNAEFTYAPPESFLKLSLDGKQGKRNFDLRWHDQREKPGLGL